MKRQKKTMKDNTIVAIAFLVCIFLFGILAYVDTKLPKYKIETDTVIVRDTVWRDTTITEKEFVPKIIIKKKTDTVFTKEGDTLNLITESKRYEKRLISGKDTADVQIYTTGINTSLDSLRMRLRTHTEVNTIEITKYIEKKRTFKDRIHFAPNVSVGYGVFSRKPDLYIGFGVNIDL